MAPKLKLSLLIFVLASPIFASYIAYYFWRPTGAMNYGELLPTKPVALNSLQSLGGEGPEAVAGKWLLLTVDSGQCDAACAQKLYVMRQVRIAQGKHVERVARAFVVDDSSALGAQIMNDYKGTVMLKGNDPVLNQLPAADSVRNHIFLIDPLGNLVLRYPADPDPKRMIKDLTRLLNVSKIG